MEKNLTNTCKILVLFTALLLTNCESGGPPPPARTKAPATSAPASTQPAPAPVAPTPAPDTTPSGDLAGPIDITPPKAPPTTPAPAKPASTPKKIRCQVTLTKVTKEYFGNSGIGGNAEKAAMCKNKGGSGCTYTGDVVSKDLPGYINCTCITISYFETAKGSCDCANSPTKLPAGAKCVQAPQNTPK